VELMSDTAFPSSPPGPDPAAGAAVVALIPRQRVRPGCTSHRPAVSLVTLHWPSPFAPVPDSFAATSFTSDHIWAKSLGIHWSLGVDGISCSVMMAAVLFR